MSSYEEIELTLLQEKYDIDFLIVIATDIELEKSLEQLLPWQDKIIKTYSGSNTFYCGLYGLYTCAIVKTNQMGAVLSGAALQTTSESIDAIKPKAVIMGGIALGKSSEKQKLGDILVSKSIILYEQARVNEGGEVDYRGPKPESSRFLLNRLIQHTTHNYSFDNVEKVAKVLSGPILTGEKLIDDSEFKNVLFKQFPDAIGGEMEAAGVYAACNAKNIPWIIV
jgi:nucleoside phosphorylase